MPPSSASRNPALVQGWEEWIVARALRASSTTPFPAPDPEPSPALVREAVRWCHRVSSTFSRTFHLASALLPAPQRSAIRVLYAFCRTADELLDAATPDLTVFRAWRLLALSGHFPRAEPVLLAFSLVRARYRIPSGYVRDFLDGVALDLTRTRYDTFDELARYCYGVASTVGLMSMHILGFSGPQAVPYAVRLGVALQLTNILRDVGEDLRRGRIYLPRTELREYGVPESHLLEARVDPAWRAFMRFQVDRARALYRSALPGIRYLHPRGRTAVAAAAVLYEGILDAIEHLDYDVFRHRATVGPLHRAALLARALRVSRKPNAPEP